MARNGVVGEVALGGSVTSDLRSCGAAVVERNACDGGDEGSQDRDEGENPHSVWTVFKRECGWRESVGWREREREREREKEKREAKRNAGETRARPTVAVL
jgi:hypothetical protein